MTVLPGPSLVRVTIFRFRIFCERTRVDGLNRALKNKHPAVSQGMRRFGKRSIGIDM
jgi:hypothetical protein